MKKLIQILLLFDFWCFGFVFAQKNTPQLIPKNSAITKSTSDKHWQFLNENIHNGQDFFNEKKEEHHSNLAHNHFNFVHHHFHLI